MNRSKLASILASQPVMLNLTGHYWVNPYNFFILEVVRAWVDTAIKAPQTMHHRGNGVFAVAGETIRLRSAMK